MELLRLLEKIRNPFFDVFFSLITHLGEEVFFMGIAIIFFWCLDKRRGLFILITWFAGSIVNQTLKLIFRISRPWVLDPDFKIVESARAEATGYSFPSGHTQSIVGTTGAIVVSYKNRVLRIVVIVIAALVCFSRMYLGVHTPWDVLASIGAAILLVLLFEPVFRTEENMIRFMPWLCGGFFLCTIAALVFVLLQPVGIHEEENLVSAMKNAATMIGCSVALPLFWFLDRKWIRFETAASWYVQIIKIVVGLGIVIGMKVLLASPLNALFGNEYVGRAVRYFLIVLFAGAGWPFCFRYLAKIKIPALDRFGERVRAAFSKKERTE